MSENFDFDAIHDADLDDEALDRTVDGKIKVSTSCITCVRHR